MPKKITTEINPYTIASSTELNAIHRTLAKRANQRLVRLERSASKVTGESYSSYGAASYAYEYLESQGRKRFSENKKYSSNFDLLRKEILELQKFLGSKSSTVAGQREIETERIQTFKDKGIHFANNKQFYDFITSKDFSDITKTFDSDKVVEMYDLAREHKSHDEIMDVISKAVDAMREKENYSLKELKKGLNLI